MDVAEAFRSIRIRVHRIPCTSAKVMTSQSAVLGRVARETSHAASRVKLNRRRRRPAVAGKEEALDITSRVARFALPWNQLGVNKSLEK